MDEKIGVREFASEVLNTFKERFNPVSLEEKITPEPTVTKSSIVAFLNGVLDSVLEKYDLNIIESEQEK